MALDRIEIFKDQKLTIGLDLGDRFSHYCILNGAGDVIGEHNLPTTPKGFEEVFARIPRSRIALETGTHSPWVSRLAERGGKNAKKRAAIAVARKLAGTTTKW